MTEPFPSKAYQELCIEKRDELPEWGPRPGDLCVSILQGLVCLIGARRRQRSGHFKYDLILISGETVVRPGGRWDTRDLESIKENFIPLPTQRQLIEMIEEKGYEWMLWRRGLMQFYRCEFKKDGKPPIERTEGPDPASTLLRCLLAVMKGGEDE